METFGPEELWFDEEPVGQPGAFDDLLDEDLVIPREALAAAADESVWLKELIDEEFSTPPPPEPAVTRAPSDDFLPPPPKRLLSKLFEPDPDDPMVQSLRAAEAERAAATEPDRDGE
ncbi:MAG: hypothetical protein AB1673_08710 [Actinomycetota bacterium]